MEGVLYLKFVRVLTRDVGRIITIICDPVLLGRNIAFSIFFDNCCNFSLRFLPDIFILCCIKENAIDN